MRAKLKAVNDQLKQRRHQPLPVQGRWLARVVGGHMACYAVPGNIQAVTAFRDQVTRHWRRGLRRTPPRSRPSARWNARLSSLTVTGYGEVKRTRLRNHKACRYELAVGLHGQRICLSGAAEVSRHLAVAAEA